MNAVRRIFRRLILQLPLKHENFIRIFYFLLSLVLLTLFYYLYSSYSNSLITFDRVSVHPFKCEKEIIPYDSSFHIKSCFYTKDFSSKNYWWADDFAEDPMSSFSVFCIGINWMPTVSYFARLEELSTFSFACVTSKKMNFLLRCNFAQTPDSKYFSKVSNTRSQIQVSIFANKKNQVLLPALEVFDSVQVATLKPKFKYVLVAKVSNHHESDILKFVVPWIAHHLSIGIEHFYLYVDEYSAEKSLQSSFKNLIYRGVVTVVTWTKPGDGVFKQFKNRKNAALTDYIAKFGYQSVWAGVSDIDSYILPLSNGKPLNNIASVFEQVDSPVSQVLIGWFIFGNSGKDKCDSFINQCLFHRSKIFRASEFVRPFDNVLIDSFCPFFHPLDVRLNSNTSQMEVFQGRTIKLDVNDVAIHKYFVYDWESFINYQSLSGYISKIHEVPPGGSLPSTGQLKSFWIAASQGLNTVEDDNMKFYSNTQSDWFAELGKILADKNTCNK